MHRSRPARAHSRPPRRRPLRTHRALARRVDVGNTFPTRGRACARGRARTRGADGFGRAGSRREPTICAAAARSWGRIATRSSSPSTADPRATSAVRASSARSCSPGSSPRSGVTRDILGRYPLLLLDDVMSELDADRRAAMLEQGGRGASKRSITTTEPRIFC